MAGNIKIKQTNGFTEGMATDIAIEFLENTKYRYMLNCNVLSTAEGNVGIVTNLKGNIKIETLLPEGDNMTIGVCLDEESDRFFYAIWNSNNFHSWYMFDAVSMTCIPILRSVMDSGGDDILRWSKSDVILHANIVQNNLLYWSLEGHEAGKFNIDKALDKSVETGYGDVIFEDYIRANKKPPMEAPQVTYITDTAKKFNRVYGSLFKFTARFIYDDGEKSFWSDFSKVAVPDFESFTGGKGIPETNNGISVKVPTGSNIVDKIEIAMQKTNPEGGVMSWVSVIVLDKKTLGITSEGLYEFRFFNDTSAIATDIEKIIKPYSFLPKNPACQEFTNNSMIYANFWEGFPVLDVDMTAEVRYDDLFIDSGAVPGENDPVFIHNVINRYDERDSWGWSSTIWRHLVGEIVVGPDVKAGNVFTAIFSDGKKSFPYSYKATLSDTSSTVANKFASMFRTNGQMNSGGGWVGEVTTDFTETSKFQFDIWNNNKQPDYNVTTSATPIDTITLKDNGQSVNNIKLNSSTGYGIFIKDEYGKRSLVYSDNTTVSIKSINELGGIKRPVITLSIHSEAPSWGKSYQIARTDDLVYKDYIQFLVQKTLTTTTDSGDVYLDLVVGSLYAYQKTHPNTSLNYAFDKGDRLRLISNFNGTQWTVNPTVKEYEVIEYKDVVSEIMNQNIVLDGTDNVKTDSPSPDDIGSFISVDGLEREIIAVSGDGYTVSKPFSTGDTETTRTFPAFELINRRGVLRVKLDTAFPIVVDPSTNKFALIEVYKPSINSPVVSEENYYSFGYEFPIIEVDGKHYYSGNVQDQTDSQPAKVEISEGNNYVRNRELPTNMDSDNQQVLVSLIEDPGYSDFYVSDLSSNGRLNVLDTADGEVHFGSRVRFSNNYIEGTRINGLNDFDNLDRVDYNDKYGDIKRLLYDEGRLYVFKHLKYAWVPVYGNLITDEKGTELISASSELLPKKLQYFLWEGGVGNNPESIVRDGNNVYSVSPNSGVICRLGGNGIIPISKTFGIDKEARDIISNASLSGAKMFGSFDRKNGNYVLSVEGYEKIIFNQRIVQSDWDVDNVGNPVEFEVVVQPLNGQVFILDNKLLYEPNLDFVGNDVFYYKAIGSSLIRQVEVMVLNDI